MKIITIQVSDSDYENMRRIVDDMSLDEYPVVAVIQLIGESICRVSSQS